MFGPQLIMTDDILDRLVGLAHSGKVSDITSISTQVSWRHIDLWGSEVLDLIKKYYPLDEPDSPRPALRIVENMPGPSDIRHPPTAPSATASSSRDPKPTRVRWCSACGSDTHIGMLHSHYSPTIYS